MSGAPRGVDFFVNWSQGSWAERRVKESINAVDGYTAIQYGPSRGEPFQSLEEFERYSEQYEDALDEYDYKRPDILVFRDEVLDKFTEEEREVIRDGKVSDTRHGEIIASACAGIEVETSLWKIRRKQELGDSLSITVKKEDYQPLTDWIDEWNVPIFVLQVFFDDAYIVQFDSLSDPVRQKEESKRSSVTGFRRRKNSDTSKVTYYVDVLKFPGIAQFGEFVDSPDVDARFLERDDGKVMPYVAFSDGKIKITTDLDTLF